MAPGRSLPRLIPMGSDDIVAPAESLSQAQSRGLKHSMADAGTTYRSGQNSEQQNQMRQRDDDLRRSRAKYTLERDAELFISDAVRHQPLLYWWDVLVPQAPLGGVIGEWTMFQSLRNEEQFPSARELGRRLRCEQHPRIQRPMTLAAEPVAGEPDGAWATKLGRLIVGLLLECLQEANEAARLREASAGEDHGHPHSTPSASSPPDRETLHSVDSALLELGNVATGAVIIAMPDTADEQQPDTTPTTRHALDIVIEVLERSAPADQALVKREVVRIVASAAAVRFHHDSQLGVEPTSTDRPNRVTIQDVAQLDFVSRGPQLLAWTQLLLALRSSGLVVLTARHFVEISSDILIGVLGRCVVRYKKEAHEGLRTEPHRLLRFFDSAGHGSVLHTKGAACTKDAVEMLNAMRDYEARKVARVADIHAPQDAIHYSTNLLVLCILSFSVSIIHEEYAALSLVVSRESSQHPVAMTRGGGWEGSNGATQ